MTNSSERESTIRLSDALRAHAAEIEAKGAHGEGPTAGDTEDYSADAQEAERRKEGTS